MSASKVDRRRPRIAYPDTLEVEGNKGGSYVRLDCAGMPEGMVWLAVGETCVKTIDQDISVAALAIILTVAKDIGFQKIVDEYCRNSNGTPVVSVKHDMPCQRCGGEGWLDPIGPMRDGSYITARPCPRCNHGGYQP